MNDTASIGVGLLGYGFMGRAHAHAYQALRHLKGGPRVKPRLLMIGGRTEAALAEARSQLGFEEHASDWRALVDDDRIALFDNAGPNNIHREPTVAAARAGKHVVCEKPLGREADESFQIWTQVAGAGVHHMCAFNYRFVPAVRLAREILEAGDLGEVWHFRARYLQDWIVDPDLPMVWRLDRSQAGSGALGDLGAHLVDLARYLVGEPAAVTATTATFMPERDGGTVDVDDAFEATVAFDGGAIGTLEASRVCLGRKNGLTFEVNGSKGSLGFDLERLNDLQLNTTDGGSCRHLSGFRTVLVTEPEHPFLEHWWPPGHVLGWEHTFVHELAHLLEAITDGPGVAPHGATLEDGYRAAEVCDAIARSARSGRRETVSYRALAPDGAASSSTARELN